MHKWSWVFNEKNEKFHYDIKNHNFSNHFKKEIDDGFNISQTLIKNTLQQLSKVFEAIKYECKEGGH